MTPLRSNHDETIKFLRWFAPDGPWFLTAIPYDQNGTVTKRFSPDQEIEVRSWLAQYQEMNLYYSVDTPRDDLPDVKASKKDIKDARFLRVDIDGARDERDLNEIMTRVRNHPTRPSAVIFSGGGVQALWRLTDVLILDGDERGIAEIELRNQQLILELDGDKSAWDVSRVLRLPGTVNVLSKTKTASGREPAETSVIWLEDSKYNPYNFLPKPAEPKNRGSSPSGEESTTLERTDDLDHLGITDKLKMILRDGHDLDDKAWNGDRSSVLYWAVCEMKRQNVKREIILGIITDSRYRISESVLDKGSRVMQYANRQIDRAKAEVLVDPRLAQMNDRYAVVRDYGGRCMVMIEEAGGKMRFQRPEEFFRGHDNEHIAWQSKRNPEKMVVMGVGTWWFDQPLRQQYEHVVFEPGVETPGDLNLWRSFAVEPRQGTRHLRYLEHMRENICRGDDARYQYLIKWMARVVQTPNTQSMVAIVLQGDRGTGKSIFAKFFAHIFGIGRHAFVAKDDREITGRFNSHLSGIVFLLAEEAFDVRDKRHDSVLKELITGDYLAVEGKGANISQMKNYVHLMMTSNNEKVVPAGDKERRYLVMRVGDSSIQNGAYFRRILEDQEAGGPANLLHHLLSVDLTGFDVCNRPETQELIEQQSHNLAVEDDWLWSKLESGVWLSTMRVPWIGPVVKEVLYREYLQSMTSINVSRPMSLRQWGLWMKKALPDVLDKQLSPQKDRTRPWAFVFPTLEKCRVYFAARRGQTGHMWPIIEEDEVMYEDKQGAFD